MAMFNPPHPGGLITEYLEDYNVSLRSLAKSLGVAPATLSRLAAGKTSISAEMALRLEIGMGISARIWLAMQLAYDLDKARKVTDVSGVIPHPGRHQEHEAKSGC